ncbi:GDP-mannose transporter [Thelotrema lepadinum]|nr:GDP-mannose transporter [Thelotrema lepadinum]
MAIYSSSKAIQFLPIPIYTVFKNLTIILIAFGETLLFGEKISSLEGVSFVLIVASSILSGWNDIIRSLQSVISLGNGFEIDAHTEISYRGYAWMIVNCFCSAGYILCIRQRIKLTKFKDFDTMFYNSLLATPIFLLLALLTEDSSTANLVRNFPLSSRVHKVFAMILTGLGTACIAYTSAWCVRVTTAATYSMVGALNKIPVAMSGYVFFRNSVTLNGILSIVVGTISGIVYGIAKQQK